MRFWTILVMFVVTATSAGCGGDPPREERPPPEVTVRRPQVRDVTDHLEFTGRLEAFQRVEVRPRVQGYLMEIHFDDGQDVSVGQELFTIDPRPFEAELAEDQAEVRRQEALVEQARWVLERNEKAVEQNAVSELAVIESRANLADVEAQLQTAKATVERSALDVEYTQVASPIAGRVSRRLVDVGNLVGSGEATLLAVVVQDDPVYAYFPVSERELTLIRSARDGSGNGQDGLRSVQIALGDTGEFNFDGTVEYADNEVDPATGTLLMRATISNPDGDLVPGQFVRVRMPVRQLRDALLVPEAALARDQSGDYVYTVGSGDVVKQTYVELGPKDGRDRVVTNGLGGDEQVIIEGIQRAQPGAQVQTGLGNQDARRQDDPAAAAAEGEGA